MGVTGVMRHSNRETQLSVTVLYHRRGRVSGTRAAVHSDGAKLKIKRKEKDTLIIGRVIHLRRTHGARADPEKLKSAATIIV